MVLSRNVSVILISIVVLLTIFTHKLNLKIFIIALIIAFLIFSLFYEVLLVQYQIKFSPDLYGQTAASTIFNLDQVLLEYKNNFFSQFIGNYVLTNNFNRGGVDSELRLLMYPIYYGWLWAFIFFSILIKTIIDSRAVLLSQHSRAFTLAGFGTFSFFLFILLDIHYPSFDRHGPYEMLFMLAAMTVTMKQYLHEET